MRLLHLDWPHLPYRLEAARAVQPLPGLVVIGGQPWSSGNVIDCSPGARSLGVRRGQALATAHKLVPEACFLDADEAAYRAAMEAALDALAGFTPSLESDAAPGQPGFGRVLLGIEGLHRLWGDEAALFGRVTATVAGLLPGAPRAGIGNTRFGAGAAAMVGAAQARRAAGGDANGAAGDGLGAARAGAAGNRRALEVIPAGDAATEAAYLAPLPIRLLPADDEARERLRVFGLTTIGQLAALSRSAVVARFGEPGGVLHDLARGLDGRPLRPRRPIERLRAEAELEPPLEELEPLRFVLRHLCATLCEQLSARGSGAGHATLLLELERAPSLRLVQSLPEPASAPELIERLLLARLTATPPPAPVARLVLELDGTAPAAGQQLGLFAPQLARAGRLDWQIAGLSIRFGADRLVRARILDPEATLPEQRVEWLAASAGPM